MSRNRLVRRPEGAEDGSLARRGLGARQDPPGRSDELAQVHAVELVAQVRQVSPVAVWARRMGSRASQHSTTWAGCAAPVGVLPA